MSFLSVVRIITTLKNQLGTFSSVAPQLVGSGGLAGDMIYYAKGVSRVYLRVAIRA